MAVPASQDPTPGRWITLGAVSALGFASGAPNSGLGEILPIWLASHRVPVELIGLLPLAGLPYAIKFLWAPLLDRWPIPWPDRRRGWIVLLQILLGVTVTSLALLHPDTDRMSLAGIGLVALIVAVLSATQDIVIDAYRTDLLPDRERGAGAAANSLGFRGGTLALGSGALLIAGWAGYPVAFLSAGILMLLLVPCTLASPKLPPLLEPVQSLRQAVVGRRELRGFDEVRDHAPALGFAARFLGFTEVFRGENLNLFEAPVPVRPKHQAIHIEDGRSLAPECPTDPPCHLGIRQVHDGRWIPAQLPEQGPDKGSLFHQVSVARGHPAQQR
jgi:MFS family permease